MGLRSSIRLDARLGSLREKGHSRFLFFKKVAVGLTIN